MITLASQGLRFALQLAGLAILSRLLAPESFGLLAMILAIAGIASVIGDFGLSLAAVQAPALSPQARSTLFWANASVGLAATLVVFGLGWLIADFYQQPDLVGLTQFVSLAFLFNGLVAQYRADLTRRMDFAGLAAGEVLSQMVGLAIAVTLGLLGQGAWALAWQQVGAAGALLALLAVRTAWLPLLTFRMSILKTFLGFGASATLTQVVNYLTLNLGSVAIGRILGAASVGLYTRAFSIFMMPLQQLAAPMTRVALPTLAGIQDHARFIRYAARAQLVLAYTLVPLLALLAITAQPFVELVLGSMWGEAAMVLKILCLGGVFQALGYVYYWIFLARARMGVLLVCELVGRAAIVVLTIPLVQFGISYVAGAYATGLFLIWLVTSLFGLKAVRVDFGSVGGAALRPLVIFGAIAGIMLLLEGAPWVRDLPSLPLFGVLSGGTILGGVLAVALWPAFRRDFATAAATIRMSVKR